MDRLKFLNDTIEMLSAQGDYAIVDGHCGYRHGDKKCAIGMHIPEECYYRVMEGETAASLVEGSEGVRKNLESKYGPITDTDLTFLDDVQSWVHDIPAEKQMEPAIAFSMEYAAEKLKKYLN